MPGTRGRLSVAALTSAVALALSTAPSANASGCLYVRANAAQRGGRQVGRGRACLVDR